MKSTNAGVTSNVTDSETTIDVVTVKVSATEIPSIVTDGSIVNTSAVLIDETTAVSLPSTDTDAVSATSTSVC